MCAQTRGWHLSSLEAPSDPLRSVSFIDILSNSLTLLPGEKPRAAHHLSKPALDTELFTRSPWHTTVPVGRRETSEGPVPLKSTNLLLCEFCLFPGTKGFWVKG
jgi:hypothetical protein